MFGVAAVVTRASGRLSRRRLLFLLLLLLAGLRRIPPALVAESRRPYASINLNWSAASNMFLNTTVGFFFQPSTYVSTLLTYALDSGGEIPSTKAMEIDSAGPGNQLLFSARYVACTIRFSAKNRSKSEPTIIARS
ncbi:unnamed protein product, partial [Sphacelaria rigidula]